MGYTDIYCFMGGILEWRNFNYPMTIDHEYLETAVNVLSPVAFKEVLDQNDNIFILDVRPGKYPNQVFLQGTVNYPLVDLADLVEQIPTGRKVVVTDVQFVQSPIAAKFLIRQGYEVAGVLRGGVVRWSAEGYPVEMRKHFLGATEPKPKDGKK